SLGAVETAAAAAASAQPGWARRSLAERIAHLDTLKQAITARASELADAIVLETGKIRSEARQEVQTLINRFDLARGAIDADLREGAVAAGEVLRFHPLGVVGVIGPFDYPLHVVHAHVVPALLPGN